MLRVAGKKSTLAGQKGGIAQGGGIQGGGIAQGGGGAQSNLL